MSVVYKRESRQLKGWMINPTETSIRASEIFKIASWQPVGGLGATQCYFYKVRLELKKKSFLFKNSDFWLFFFFLKKVQDLAILGNNGAELGIGSPIFKNPHSRRLVPVGT